MLPQIDSNLCLGCGMCYGNCPDCFEPYENNRARVKTGIVWEEKAKCVEEAMDNCPVGAISWKETD
ncbi:ferredoxin [Candidatus Peregrinibacteria bacterium CG08_land_8_20_14_0_20_41_10]|nr:MAG: hypothetical protein AUJ78_01860 [Candidatus Peregrinibacteria bacterium CG1_02_41_10]PIS32438.1 MAG: ferredoxin [Candidatus Peregrinibacteria bacterium CG08_land_8_20_14_0_20_41_10]